MECVICKNGQTAPGIVSVTVERENSIVVIKDVPALVCNNCGHYYLTNATSQKIFLLANESIERGAEIEILRLKLAS